MKSSSDIRRAFLEYFRERGHQVVPSSPLVPANDPTLLFTNAGMVQFKETFLGRERRPYRRAASAQRCVRAGGKHNDLENVGYTARHHTFFEMLGNFSFGDYFKREAIAYAWEFLTSVAELAPEKLWVTVYEEDEEAARIWLEKIGVDPHRFGRIGAKDNFWAMGETGPCGPCSEIFYDHGPEVAGGPPGSVNEEGDRYIEIWNLVFMQYDRAADGNLTPLPKPSVDTGMGLERLAAVLQGVHDNYQIDIFRSLMRRTAELAGLDDPHGPSLKVIADHIRACAFLIVDGVLPSNEGRGYVLRRIIRRAVRHGHRLGIRDSFFHRLVGTLCQQMGDAYPDLPAARERIERTLRVEEERFAETLEQGLRILEHAIAELSGVMIPGETVFRLYDTYGFPLDLTADIARERGLDVDTEGFERAMQAQRDRARAASQFAGDRGARIDAGATQFIGYDRFETDATVEAIYRGDEPVTSLAAGEEGIVVLDRTPFYAESGGQVGDTGMITTAGARFAVRDTQKQADGVYRHIGQVREGRLEAGQQGHAQVDAARRQAIMLNHSATHLVHAALRKVLGDHVTQKGSRVEPQRLRFDFSHFGALSREELTDVERLVNDQVRRNAVTETRVTSLEEALASGALAFFGEKYDDEVRVLRLGDFSTELCGGTHVRQTGDIGFFKILSESGVASGVRRIEAVTGAEAVAWVEQSEAELQRIAELLHSGRDTLGNKIGQLVERVRSMEKEIDRLQGRLASMAGEDLTRQAIDVRGMKVLAARVEAGDAKTLRETLDRLKNKLGSAAVVLASVSGDKIRLVAGVTPDKTEKIKAGELVNAVAEQVGGRGGGRPDMAQAGGNRPESLERALRSVPEWVEARLRA